jgi:hypothetical protein
MKIHHAMWPVICAERNIRFRVMDTESSIPRHIPQMPRLMPKARGGATSGVFAVRRSEPSRHGSGRRVQ